MANYPQDLAQYAVCQSHTGHMTELRFLPTQPLRLNTNEWMNHTFISAFVIQHAKRTRLVVFPSVTCPAVTYVPHYLTNGTILSGREYIEHKMCVSIVSTALSEKKFSSKKNSAKYYHKCTLVFMYSNTYSYPVLLEHELSPQILNTHWSINFMKIRPVVAELFHAYGHSDRQTWRSK